MNGLELGINGELGERARERRQVGDGACNQRSPNSTGQREYYYGYSHGHWMSAVRGADPFHFFLP